MTKDSSSLLTIASDEKDAIKSAIDEKQTFRVLCHSGTQKFAVQFLEKEIEGRSMRCRIYTSKRIGVLAAGLIPTGVTQAAAVYSGIAMAVHNLATLNPDYEIRKDAIGSDITVVYMK